MTTTTIRETTLRELISSNTVSSAEAVGRPGGFAVVVRYGETERFLISTRGSVRVFSNLTNLAVFLRGLGIERFDVNSSRYQAGRVRSARPDRAEALKRTRTVPRQSDLLT